LVAAANEKKTPPFARGKRKNVGGKGVTGDEISFALVRGESLSSKRGSTCGKSQGERKVTGRGG